MKYMLLIITPGTTPPPDAEMSKILAQYQKFTDELQSKGKLVHSARLRPTPEAKTVKTGRGGERSVIDGPFTETKEAVGGYYMIESASQAEAVEWAKKIPASVVEVRP